MQHEATSWHAATHNHRGIHSGSNSMCNMGNCTTRGNTEHWHTKWQQLYGRLQHRALAYKMAATAQYEATVQHAATHNTVAYTVSETVQHEPLYSMLTLAFTVVATEPHEATLWHVPTQYCAVHSGGMK